MNGLNLEKQTRNYMANSPSPFPIILAIDPSMNNFGWAVHNLNLGQNRYDIDSEAWRFGLINPMKTSRREVEKQYKWNNVYEKLRAKLEDWKPTHFAAEYPTFFGSVSGKIAAQKDYTLDLAGIVGYLAGRFAIHPDFVCLWRPQQWKWNVPKHVTQAKFIRLFGKNAEYVVRNNSHDVIDAIMICEHWLTLYHREKFSWIRRNVQSATSYGKA